MAATRELPELKGYSCVAGIDYAKTDDFVVAGLLFKVGELRYWLYHVWVCKYCKDLSRIKYPLKKAEKEGILTFVDEVEIAPKCVIDWLSEMGKKYIIECVAMDDYRYTLMRESLKKIGFTPEKKRVKLVRPSDKEKVATVIGHIFARHLIAWGTCTIMRWFTWNTKAKVNKKGNIEYEKMEEKSRKTDGFYAYVAAETVEDMIKQRPKIGRRLTTVC